MAGGSRFRLPYKRQKYYHRRNKDYPVSNQHVTSLINPFESSNGQPKWPDGLATFSIGRRHQLTSEIYNPDFYIVIFPGAINWCVAFDIRTGTGQAGFNEPTGTITTANRTNPGVWANHSANISINYEFNEKVARDTYDEFALEVAHDAFSSWRNVATACHLQIINTTDSNEGWFKATRLTRTREDQKLFDVVMGKGSAYGNGNHILETPHFHTGGLVPSQYFLENIEDFFLDQPSLVTGELQDIHNAVFQLNETKERNEFTDLRTTYVLQPKDTERKLFKRDKELDFVKKEFFAVHNDPNNRYIRNANYKNSRSEFDLLSDSKDMILIHVVGGAQTKVLIHSVNNQEFLVSDNSQLAQYVTPCQYDKVGLQRYNQKRNFYHKYPYHYLTNINATEKAIPAPFYNTSNYHHQG